MRSHFIVAALTASVIAAPLPDLHHDVHDVAPYHGPLHSDPHHVNYNPHETMHEYEYAHTPEHHAHAYSHGFEGHMPEHFDSHSGHAEHGHDVGHGEYGHGFISELRHGLFSEYGFDAMHTPEHLLEPTFLHETPHHGQYSH